MPTPNTTQDAKPSGAISDQHPDQSKPATTPGQPVEKAAAASSDSHVEQVKKPRGTLRRFTPVLVILIAVALLILITSSWNSWVGRTGSQKTDDAYLRADITPLSTRVSGTVTQVAVEDYQKVRAGDLLVQIKDDDYRAQVEQSEAAV